MKKQPKYFQVQSVDNFFSKPEEVVKFANSFEYKKGPNGFWPGKRSEELHINHNQFFNSFLTLIMALSCGTPIPATSLVVQIEPGPMPTFKISAPSL